ncbi:unnamed protein product [Phytomonas sp. Hart1]|nr:unnamed protein product [Phytomonas sp. Hart1]|eukprot:CCW66419.1 unnamed protein product [Phytomonas sp. isolate Hart1]
MPKHTRAKNVSSLRISTGPNSSGFGSKAESILELDPSIIYFTFSRIRPTFSCGRSIQSTLKLFQLKKMHPKDLPLISVFTDGTHYYSQNNRRLFMYKKLKEMAILNEIPVRVRALPSTKRMSNKYSPTKCSLTATLMREKNTTTGADSNSEEEKGEENDKNDSLYGKDSLDLSLSSLTISANKKIA